MAFQQMLQHPKLTDHEGVCFCEAPLQPLVQFGQAVEYQWSGGKVAARVCTRCGYVSFPPPSEERLAVYYSEEFGRGSEEYYTYEKDYDPDKTRGSADIAIALAKTFHPGHEEAVVLELGCAYGGAVAELRKRGLKAFGLDLSSSAIAEGRARGNEFIFNKSPKEFFSETGIRADVVISFHMLEHVPKLPEYLEALKPVLNDGGVAMFRVPNGAYARPWLHGFPAWDWFAYPDHLHMLSPNAAACLVRKCGFELVGLRSNTCGEAMASVTQWLPEGIAASNEAVGRLAAAGCLMELEFVLRKPGGAQPVDLAKLISETSSMTKRYLACEQAIKRHASFFIFSLLSET